MENRELTFRTVQNLMEQAKQAQQKAYAPYSRFKVGSALLTESGKVYTGCNIENSSYPVGLCAERTAIAKAISEGERHFVALALVGGNNGKPCLPCGMCRQFMTEFCTTDFKIFVQHENDIKTYTLAELLPYAFKLETEV